MLIVVHPERNDILDELEVSLFQKRYPRVIMEEQVNKYLDEGFPRNYGLSAMGFIFRQHNEEISQVMADWWDEIIKYSYQDQLSFPYVCWKNDFHPSVSLINYEGNDYWDKPPGNRHKKEFKTPFNSYRLLDKMENQEVETLTFNNEELNLIKNDLKVLNNIKIEDINFNFFDAIKFKIKKSTLGLIIYQLIEDIKKSL